MSQSLGFSCSLQSPVSMQRAAELKPHARLALPAVLMPWVQDPACGKQIDSSFQCAMGEGKKNGFCSSDRNVEEPLAPWDGGMSPHPKVPGNTDKRTHRRLLGELCRVPPVCVVVLAVLVALVLALAAAVAVLSAAGGGGGNPALPAAPVLACPDGWVGYRGVCYYLSKEEGSWEWSQEQCSSRGASLAVLRMSWEMELLSRLKGNVDYWLGLRREGERLEWVDGSRFNETFQVFGGGACVYLNKHAVASSSCSQHRPFICSSDVLSPSTDVTEVMKTFPTLGTRGFTSSASIE